MMLALLLQVLAYAQEECPTVDETLSDPALLRAISLELRGTIPTADEYGRVRDGESPEALLDEWLDTPEFVDRVIRHHRALLWPNVSDIRLLSNRQRLLYDYDDRVYWRYLVAPNYRGGPVSCGDFEASWDEHGELVLHEQEDGTVREGWVWVNPYWAPDTQVRVCAFEAQEERVSPWGTECDTYDSRYDPYCGCGPNLAWCDTPTLGHVQDYGVQAPVHKAIAGDLEHRVGHVIEEDLSYLELLTGRTAFVNGPLTHFYKYQTRAPAHVRFNEFPIDPETLPDLAYTDTETWVPIQLGEEHSGILTSPAYMMKFQTRRGRANRFYNAFLCQPFQPPDGGILLSDDPSPTADLTQREGCRYCHALLEPAASHWGRWGEYGIGYLDPADFPAYSDECSWCANTGASCSPECSLYYMVDPITAEDDPFVGWLRSYQFLEERYEPHVEEGPRLMVHEGVVDGRLPRCVAKNTATWLLGREPEDYEAEWIQDLADEFTGTDYRYKALVKSILLSDNYRRTR